MTDAELLQRLRDDVNKLRPDVDKIISMLSPYGLAAPHGENILDRLEEVEQRIGIGRK
jgi:hypothetical protein